MADDTDVRNSQRRLFRVTYTPLAIPSNAVDADLLVRGAFMRMLGLDDGEVNQDKHGRRTLDGIRGITDARTEGEYMTALGQLRHADPDDLGAVADDAANSRRAEIDAITQSVLALDREHQAAPAPARSTDAPSAVPAVPHVPTVAAQAPAATAAATMYDREPAFPDTRVVDTPVVTPAVVHPPAPVASPQPLHPLLIEQLGPAVAARLLQTLRWASLNRPQAMLHLSNVLGAPSAEPDDVLVAANAVLPAKLRRRLIAKRVSELIAQRVFEVVGLLHLERLVMTPGEVERGELLYSLPLAPDETVTLAHKEWSIHEEEYSRYIQDYMKDYSETGVAQTTEMAKTTETQTRRQDATSANPTSMSGQPVSITSPIAADAGGPVVEAASSAQESVTQTKTITSKASSRTIQDHKISFTVTTVRESEDWPPRLIRNTHADRTMTIDYYRRMRRWRNELYRYGVRLTYDLVVPHPGRRLLARYDRLRELDAEITKGFVSAIAPMSITPSSWTEYASLYDVPLPPPPPDLTIEEALTLNYPHFENRTEEIQLVVPGGNRLTSLGFEIDAGTVAETYPDTGAVVFIGSSMWNLLSKSKVPWINTGTVSVPLFGIPDRGPVKGVFFLKGVFVGKARMYGKVTATDESLDEWRKQCWGILREVELARYQQHQDALRVERLALQRAIDAADELSLRRIEREHIMLACLEWLFPFLNLEAGWFDDVADAPTDFDRVMGLQASVLIKLVHTAIDWDSMVVTLLPFFWERTDTQATVFVDHPDPQHREFLRAGAARVVLPIQPGSEEEILSLFDFGLASDMGDSHRYKAIVDEVTAANATYAAETHPADSTLPDGTIATGYTGDYPVEGGKLIGRWHETMPTSALDIDVTLRHMNEL